MNKYLVFPVALQDHLPKLRNPGLQGYKVEATDYEAAHKEGEHHVPLFEGEQLAVVYLGKA